jgi:hypothetical protein
MSTPWLPVKLSLFVLWTDEDEDFTTGEMLQFMGRVMILVLEV